MKLLAEKVCFYVFMCFENKPVDKALGTKSVPTSERGGNLGFS
jgi:hypothetical protein